MFKQHVRTTVCEELQARQPRLDIALSIEATELLITMDDEANSTTLRAHVLYSDAAKTAATCAVAAKDAVVR